MEFTLYEQRKENIAALKSIILEQCQVLHTTTAVISCLQQGAGVLVRSCDSNSDSIVAEYPANPVSQSATLRHTGHAVNH